MCCVVKKYHIYQFKINVGVNLFISSNERGDDDLARFEAHSYRPEEVAEAWKTAKLLFELHRKVQNYDPRS